MAHYYYLEGREAIPCDLDTWAKKLDAKPNSRRVVCTSIADITVSTVFLGTNHNFDPATADEEPLIFETMVFGGAFDLYQRRWSTYDEAEEQHEKIVEMVKKDLEKGESNEI